MPVRKRKSVVSHSPDSTGPEARQGSPGLSTRAVMTTASILVLAGIAVQTLYYTYAVLPRRIATKSDLPMVSSGYDQGVWGAHRSHVYFGLRTQHPASPLFGMLWYPQKGRGLTLQDARHWCDKDNGVKSYAFTEADGRSFGRQVIHDKLLRLRTEWINDGHSWTARVNTSSKHDVNYALVFYFLLQDSNSTLTPVYKDGNLVSFGGSSLVSERFDVTFTSTVGPSVHSFAAVREEPFLDAGKMTAETVFRYTIIDEQNQLRLRSNLLESPLEDHPNLIVFQFNIPANASVEVMYSADGDVAQKGRDFEEVLNKRISEFNKRFEDIYKLHEKGYSVLHQRMGRMALSNMLGSIGYHYGYNRVRSQHSANELLYGPQELLTACPCRSTFPRGFLWDEGFHHLLFRKFDPELSLKIIASWLDTMNVDGWIPREMILGPEAEMRVPAEFIVQMDKTANPPMFFYLIERFLDDKDFAAKHTSTLINLYPRLVLWHSWLNRTQSGPLPGTYRWRGRNSTIETELNPKTLASGFDDYPRATHPTNDEYHLDLRCWMAISARVLSRLAAIAGDSEGEARYRSNAGFLRDLDLLNKLHWDEKKKRFCDYGLHSPQVALEDIPVRTKNGQALRYQNGETVTVRKRVVKKPTKLGFVSNTFGYVSLFPVMLRLLPPDSVQLKATLEQLRSEKELWTDFGLRSISKSSPFYRARNTKDDPPYWRGNVWMNMNYMMLAALKHYSSLPGLSQALAKQIYEQLRDNVVSNLAREYKRTGNLWEHYDDTTGEGGGAYPFTGWSALVLSIMAEQYD